MLNKLFFIVGLAALLAFPLSVFAVQTPIGVVLISSGDTYAISTDQQQRPLKRGVDILLGDTVVTSTSGQLQFRLNDNSSYSLKPGSKLSLVDFNYKFNGKDNKIIIKLEEGGFRTITGAVSAATNGNYEVQTPVAVIGVRGTEYSALFSSGKLVTAAWKGVISLKNQAGTFFYGLNQKYKYAVTTSSLSAPTGLVSMPPELAPCK